MPRKGLLLGLGNPLLDIEAHVDCDFLEKWDLKADGAILCDEKRAPMFLDIVQNYKVQYIAGGSTQNSMRVAQWMIGKPDVVGYFGCVGNDHFGHILKNKCNEVGLKAMYQLHATERTGACAVTFFGSLCADLGAALQFTVDHLRTPAHQEAIQQAEYYYIAGFFISSSVPSIMEIAEHACNENKCFMMNLSAPFIASMKEEFSKFLPFVDVLFGNEEEAEAFARSMQFKAESVVDIAEFIASFPKKNSNRGRTVIITQGADPIIVVSDGHCFQHPVAHIPTSSIVDTNGAGDAFVGGFLSQYIVGKELVDCLAAGVWAAHLIIQRSGCSLPEACDYKLF
ncbi:adenosine kinase [Trichuris trichiura]|uniref:Adenosine kinase n=1 Tax=Trichuris trichiura TaxID=36087 RepID=A0A077Z8B0_TRITR|nr:adenosine kinase [Trichuris trichiura]